jgi:hypothetical protein
MLTCCALALNFDEAAGATRDAAGPIPAMDVRKAAELYSSGLSLREVAARLGVNNSFSVGYQLARAGIPRRPNGNAHLYPRVTLVCDSCGRTFKRRQYYAQVGYGTRSNPKPPSRRVCSHACHRRLVSQDKLERARQVVSVEINYC